MIKRQPGFLRGAEPEAQDEDEPGTEVEKATPMQDVASSKPYPVCGAKARTTGGLCQNPPMLGAKRCRMHGSKTARSMEKARRDLDRLAHPAVTRIGKVMDDPETPPGVQLAAANSVLNRTGFTEKTASETVVEVKPYERALHNVVFSGLSRGGFDADPEESARLDRESASETQGSDVVDAEWSEDPPERPIRPAHLQGVSDAEITANRNTPGWRPTPRRPGGGPTEMEPGPMPMMTHEEAYGGPARRPRGTRMTRRG